MTHIPAASGSAQRMRRPGSPKEYRELAVKDRIFTTLAWPHVALSNGRVFCRDREGNVVCFEVGKAN